MNATSSIAREIDELKPKLRGWIHLGMAPIALTAGIILVILAPTPMGKLVTAVYAVTGLLLFSVSAIYHRGTWSPKVRMLLKRLDHTNIMLVIAGSYTPLAWALLPQQKATWLLAAIWTGAILGVAFRVLWTNAPRWLYVPIYIVLGLAALLFIGDFWAVNIPATILLCIGGALYIIGAVIYALKRPNPSPRWFGFHEIFHVFTVGGFVCHFIAIALAILGTNIHG
ncbi:PAQR family membrane homeostasis protein TrhA [Neomicrococcus lactis]|uniref:Hemolysin III n=1 Tax=Neomicrococcus lactis TaxID=732241 RepID=A0A7W9DB35_9MICC|nr:hemolysin III family protein [Neomicrococcus lactis]MBB5598293.1 hemolysin III [Neomicrococcus lactis]